MGKGKLKAKSAKLKAGSEKRKAKSESLSLVNPYSLLVVTGFMGAGKSTVGKLVAQKLGLEFVDMDRVIEGREGKSVREIFETRGEEYFRARESELCAELAARENLVIATGGGALLDAKNRERFANALIVCLDASADEILRRLNGALNRPLLADGDARQRVEELLAARRPAYVRIERHLDTTGKDVHALADQIVAEFRRTVA